MECYIYCKSISFIETQVKEAIMRTQGHQRRLLGPARSINLIHSAPEQSSSPQTQVAVARDVSAFKRLEKWNKMGKSLAKWDNIVK